MLDSEDPPWQTGKRQSFQTGAMDDEPLNRGFANEQYLNRVGLSGLLSAVGLAISRHIVLYFKLSSDATGGDQTSICQWFVVGPDSAYHFWRRGSH